MDLIVSKYIKYNIHYLYLLRLNKSLRTFLHNNPQFINILQIDEYIIDVAFRYKKPQQINIHYATDDILIKVSNYDIQIVNLSYSQAIGKGLKYLRNIKRINNGQSKYFIIDLISN